MNRLKSRLHQLIAISLSLLFVLPIYWAAIASLRKPGLPPPRSVEWWPSDPTFSNYPGLFDIVPMWRYTRNSLIVIIIALPITLIVASLAGFCLTQIGNRNRQRIIAVSIAFLIIPAASVWLFRYQILRWMGLLDSLWALIIPAVAGSSPLFVMLFYWSFRRIPPEIFEAGRLDSANALTNWWQLAMPLAKPTTVAVTILSFVLYWNDFMSPVLYIFQTDLYTLPVGVQLIKQLDETNWPLMMTAALYMTIPILITFIYLQRHFLSDDALANLFDRG